MLTAVIFLWRLFLIEFLSMINICLIAFFIALAFLVKDEIEKAREEKKKEKEKIKCET